MKRFSAQFVKPGPTERSQPQTQGRTGQIVEQGAHPHHSNLAGVIRTRGGNEVAGFVSGALRHKERRHRLRRTDCNGVMFRARHGTG